MEICVTSYEYNRSKLRAYAQASVKEVWLILVSEKQVEIYRRPENGAYASKTLAGPGGQLTSVALPAFTLDLAAFFRE